MLPKYLIFVTPATATAYCKHVISHAMRATLAQYCIEITTAGLHLLRSTMTVDTVPIALIAQPQLQAQLSQLLERGHLPALPRRLLRGSRKEMANI